LNLELNWDEYHDWVYAKYAKSWAPTVMTYSKKYSYILLEGNIKDIDKIPGKTKNTSIKALIILSKFLGVSQEFKTQLKSYGIKLFQEDALSSFIRLYNNKNSNLNEWYTKAQTVLRPNEHLFLQFLKLSGLRKEEGIMSFNKIIELSKQGKLNEYYNDERSLLEHFKYKEQFLRGTKNVYISILPKSLVLNIADSEPVTYSALYKRLMRTKVMSRINELRDNFGTFMVRNGLIKEEVDLLQGRIPPSIFIRHYWSPSFIEIKERTIQAIKLLNS
jgi:intergrase/recombinase